MVPCAGRPGYGPPLGDNGRLAEGDDGVLVFQASVVIQRGQPPFPATAGVTVQLLSEETQGVRERTDLRGRRLPTGASPGARRRRERTWG